ncbi:MAG: hypothetical protein ACOCU8_02930 [Patescibacteria group bacterium]
MISKYLKLTIILGIATIAGLALWVWLLFLSFDLAETVKNLKQQLIQQEEEQMDQGKVNRIYTDLEPAVEVLNDVFYTSGDLIILIEQLEEMARRAEVEMTISNFNDQDQPTATLRLIGQLDNLQNFMEMFSVQSALWQADRISWRKIEEGWSVSLIIKLISFE